MRPRHIRRSGWLIRATARATATAAALALGVAAAGAPPAAAIQSDPNAFVREAVFDGPADIVWRLLTTEDGVESWLAPHAKVDLRVGGYVKTNHVPDGAIGDPMTVVNRVLALGPEKSVIVRVDRTPQGYPFADMVVGTWYEVKVDRLANGRSRLRCVGHGFGGGPAAYMMRPMFERAADMVFDHLRAAVDRETATAAAAPAKARVKGSKPAAKTTPKRPR